MVHYEKMDRGSIMKRRKLIIGVLLVVLLTGCSSKDGLKTAPEQPEEFEQAEELEQAEDASPAPTRPLLSEEALAYMYQNGRPNGFDFGGVEEDGAFFYEFTRPEEPDFYLRICEDGKTATVRYHGKTMALNDRTTPDGSLLDWHISAGYGGVVSGYGMPFWADMTGDGQPDLLYLQGAVGTGVHGDHCVAYDMAAMAEIPIVEPWQEMAEFVAIETLGEENGYIQCLITDAEGHTYTTCTTSGYDEENIWKKFHYTPVKSEWTALDINEAAGTLTAAMKFGMADPHFGAFHYMGELRAELAYDAEQGAIVRSTPIAVTVYAPDKI